MGLIGKLLDVLFGGGRNIFVETAGVFRENAEHGADRESEMRTQALAQFAAEFNQPRFGLFDRVVDGLNRLPRPILAFGTIGLFIAAMSDPIWFASRMQGVALVPEPMWWLMGAIISFYFGARHQAKAQDFEASVLRTAGLARDISSRVKTLETLNPDVSKDLGPIAGTDANAALDEWRRAQ